MPLYYWRGITLEGITVAGYQKARSISDLSQTLATQWIGLMSASISRSTTFLYTKTRMLDDTFASLHFLLQAGVRIDKALNLTYNQISHLPLKELLKEVNEQVQQGTSFSHALSHHTDWFDPLTIFLISVGEESGTMPTVLLKVHQHYHRSILFQRALRVAICMPAITLFFFLCIASVLLFGVVPFFADILHTYAGDSGTGLSFILWFSHTVKNNVLLLGAFLMMCIASVWYGTYYRTRWYLYLTRISYQLPFVRHVFLLQELSIFFHALGLLLEQKISIRHAFKWALKTIRLPELHSRLLKVMDGLESGYQVADAFSQAKLPFGQEIESFIAIGQESSALDIMCFKSSQYYQARVDRSMTRWNTLIQPSLIVILGGLITGLIILIYAPLLSLSTLSF